MSLREKIFGKSRRLKELETLKDGMALQTLEYDIQKQVDKISDTKQRLEEGINAYEGLKSINHKGIENYSKELIDGLDTVGPKIAYEVSLLKLMTSIMKRVSIKYKIPEIYNNTINSLKEKLYDEIDILNLE